MKIKNKSYRLLPAILFGGVTGIITALTVTLYKISANYVISFSEKGYHFIKDKLWIIPIVLGVLYLIALLYDWVYKKEPEISGGGIPTSIGIINEKISFGWLKTLVGTFTLSIVSFFIGVPLGNEGPSVLMGTAIGKGVHSPFYKKYDSYKKYSMTGGACAGFSVATGAPISGILFAIEEAHHKISTLIIVVSSFSVLSGFITTKILESVLNIDVSLFHYTEFVSLPLRNIWITVLVGIAFGLFSVLFLKCYGVISALFNDKMKKIPRKYKIFAVFVITLMLGLVSESFISTGHHLILNLFKNSPSVVMLFIILLIRTTLTLSANTSGITGGVFVPFLALGAVFAAILGGGITALFSLGNEYYILILALGIVACISSMMKMPLTAIIFSIEAFSLYNNILSVLIVSVLSFLITELLGAESINDRVLKNKLGVLMENESDELD